MVAQVPRAWAISMATKNNKTNQSVNNQSANSLQYATYTSEKSGKTIPVVYGFTGKDDERLPYIAVLEQPKAKKGKKAKKIHGPACCTYSVLPIGKGGERIPCVIWGADPRWHDIAKLTAKVINDLDALTQEAYDDLCNRAEAVYEAKKAEGKAADEQKKSEKPAQKVKPTPKAKAQKTVKQKPSEQETTMSASKPASKGKTMTEAALMAAFEQVAKASKLNDANKGILENFLKTIIATAA